MKKPTNIRNINDFFITVTYKAEFISRGAKDSRNFVDYLFQMIVAVACGLFLISYVAYLLVAPCFCATAALVLLSNPENCEVSGQTVLIMFLIWIPVVIVFHYSTTLDENEDEDEDEDD